MVARHRDDCQIRRGAVFFPLPEPVEKRLGPDLVRNPHFATGELLVINPLQRGYAALGGDHVSPGSFFVVIPIPGPGQKRIGIINVLHEARLGVELGRQRQRPEQPDVQLPPGVLPKEPLRRNGQAIGHIPRIAARRGAQRPLHVVADEAHHQPLVPFKTDCAAGVKIVDQDELLGQSVVVGRHVAAVDSELLLAISLGHVAENLVVRSVLFDEKEHMLDAELGQLLYPAVRSKLRRSGVLYFPHSSG